MKRARILTERVEAHKLVLELQARLMAFEGVDSRNLELIAANQELTGKRIMTLPPLPEHTIDYMKNGKSYTAQQMTDYGQQCAKDALLRVLALTPGGPTMDPKTLKNEILEMLK